MQDKNTSKPANGSSSVVEDLTLNETEAGNIKGGPSITRSSFSFGVEREMKESGEKGGTE